MKKRVVIHTADWHLGKNRKYVDYLDQQRLMLEAIFKIVLEVVQNHADSEIWFLMCGDIFDRNEDTEREEFILPIVTILYPLLELKKNHTNFNFYFIDGNHDRQPYDPTDPNAMASVASPLVRMAEGHVAVHSPKWIEDKSLLLIPFGQYSVDQIIELTKKYPSEFIAMHECCAGITTDVGWKPPRDQDRYIDMGELLDGASDVKGIFLGDIHRSQSLDSKGISWYSGSPITLDHGHKMPKGVLIHHFVDEGKGWVRQGSPELMSILKYAPGLKYHTQVGVIDNPDNIPLEALSKYQSQYLQFTVSAEAYALVSRQIPGLFESPNVAWDHTIDIGEKQVAKTTHTGEESLLSYYTPLINQWILENGKELTKSERDEALCRIISDFESRN